MFRSTKSLPLLSCAFRNHRAKSHCRFVHGYAVQFTIEFEADDLDAHSWVVDFGALKKLRNVVENVFDHKTLVAQDDPHRGKFAVLHRAGVLDMVLVPDVGCEAFAKLVAEMAILWARTYEPGTRIHVYSVECREHYTNSAKYFPPRRK